MRVFVSVYGMKDSAAGKPEDLSQYEVGFRDAYRGTFGVPSDPKGPLAFQRVIRKATAIML